MPKNLPGNSDWTALAPSPKSRAAGRRYWAYLAKPSIYRIEDALDQQQFDWWPTKDKPIKVGDQVIIWRGRKSHRDRRRGVVALGEVVGGPEDRSDTENPYWVTWHPDVPQARVRVRYVVPPNLPLWLEGPADESLRALSVSRGQGTIFNVSEDQWQAIVAAAGGWNDNAPEVNSALNTLEEAAGKRSGGQGFKTSPGERRAIERHAMKRAIHHYEAQGWRVTDASATNPYDLHCTQPDGRELRVEVKGTTGDGGQVLLTAGEVRHGREHAPHVALFVLAGIDLKEGPDHTQQASGGQESVYEPWIINDENLSALAYAYRTSGHKPD